MAQLSGEQKNAWLEDSAKGLRERTKELLAANEKDVAAAPGYGLTDAAVDRLRLTAGRIEEIAVGLEAVAELPDPVGEVIESSIRPNGLKVLKTREPDQMSIQKYDIERRGISKIEDLPNQTPGLSIKDSGVNRFVTIRGVGLNATTATITSGVAIHVDGVGLWGAGIALGNPFYDLERIEVLRGPQGTFVGQNSTGGAMFIISKAPRLDEADFSVEQTFGNYDWSDTVAAARSSWW